MYRTFLALISCDMGCLSPNQWRRLGETGSVTRYNKRSRGVAQPGSASGLGPEGRRFESFRPDQ